jgi:predicted MFS family arabinose efflux permease
MKPKIPLYLLVGGLVIIGMAQILNHLQVQASTEKALTQAEISQKLVAARDLQTSFERGMGFGKPLSLFSGTERDFANLKARYEGITFLALTSPTLDRYAVDGKDYLAEVEAKNYPVFPNLKGDKSGAFKFLIQGDQVLLALPLYFNQTQLKGLVWLGFSREGIKAQLEREAGYGLLVVSVFLLVSLALFTLLFFRLIREKADAPESPLPEKKPSHVKLVTRISFAIVGVLLVSILGYAGSTNGRFTEILVKIYQKNVEVLVDSQTKTLTKLLDLQIAPEHWKKVETILGDQVRDAPETEGLWLTDTKGKVLYSADRAGIYPNAATTPPTIPTIEYAPNSGWFRSGLKGSDGALQGYLFSRVDQKFLDAILVDRLLDALTVTLVSLIFSVEFLLALGLLSRRPDRKIKVTVPENEVGIKIIRFTAFLFFMAELLPLSFMPLFISDLYTRSPVLFLSLSADAVKGLPFSAHLFGVVVFVPLIGALSNRFSLRSLFLVSGTMLLAGNFLSAFSESLPLLMLMRLISGLGYGGVLAASAGLVVQTTEKEHRTSGFAAWGAGFAAASICAVVLGGILVSHLGYRNGLLVSAVLSVAMGVFVFFFHPNRPPVYTTIEAVKSKWTDLFAPFRDRTTLVTLLFASIPVQLAFFGLFQYTLPLAMSESGLSEANIGRVLTIYGLFSLASPLLARYSDRTRNEKNLIVFGNLVTGIFLSVFFVQSGVWSMIFVVAAIGIGGLLFDTVISSYLSMTKASEKYGETKFLSIFLTWEKMFTVFVPVLVGTMMTSFGYLKSAAILGVVITAGAAVFGLFSANLKPRSKTELSEVPK